MNQDALVLVAGGTTESRAVAEAIVDAGYRVLWSQATSTPFPLKQHPSLGRRTGRLTADGWVALLDETHAAAIVDAGHPHAVELHEALRTASTRQGVPLLRLRRAPAALDASALLVKTHPEAARMACELGHRILVTVGTRHLSHYVIAARQAQARVFVRVLDVVESHDAVRALGCRAEEITHGRGPFSVEQNLELLRRIHADVLVTKDSGREGGLAEKLEAARQQGCRVIVVARPDEPTHAPQSVEELIDELQRICP